MRGESRSFESFIITPILPSEKTDPTKWKIKFDPLVELKQKHIHTHRKYLIFIRLEDQKKF